MTAEFITLEQLALADGHQADDAESYLDEIINDIHTVLVPHAIVDGATVKVRRHDLVHTYYGRRQGEVLVRREDADTYITTRLRAAEAARYTTSDRRTWADPEDRDLESKGYPVFTADGAPAFEKFRHAGHVTAWLATGDSLDNLQPAVAARLTALLNEGTNS